MIRNLLKQYLKKTGKYDKMRQQRIVADIGMHINQLKANWANAGVTDPSSVEILYSARAYIDDAEGYLINAQFDKARDALIDGAAAMGNAAEIVDAMVETFE